MKRLTRRDFLRQSGSVVLLSAAMPRLIHAEQCRIPVLLYHDIAEQFSDDYTISPSLFAAQMEMLYSQGYKTIRFNELPTLRAGCEKRIIITFDDGYASFIDYCFPLLKEYGFTANINIVGKFMGTFISSGGNRPMLSWDECRFLKKSGLVEFGCHTHNLHRLTDAAQALEQNLQSDLLRFSEVFSNEMGTYTEILAWPFGIYNQKAVRTAREHGFKYLLTSKEGLFVLDGTYQAIPRLNINNKLDIVSFREYVGGL